MDATAQLVTVNANAEKAMYCPISSRAPEESGEGSTTNANSPDRTMRQHERGAVKTCSRCKQLRSDFHMGAVWCKSCVSEYDRAIYRKKREKILAAKSKYRLANKDKLSLANKKWREKNKDYVRQYLADYRDRNKAEISGKKRTDYAANRERILAQKREYHIANGEKIVARKRAARANPSVLAKHNHIQAIRRARVNGATPSWADVEEIKDKYKLAQMLTKSTGIKHSVDHIIPLNGAVVSGLHVSANLRVIPFVENCRKSNRVLIEDIV